MMYIAMGHPRFIRAILGEWDKRKRYKMRSKEAAFYRMRKRGLITVEKKGHQYRVSLTEKGRKMAGWLQLDSLQVKRPKKWKGEWYFLMFDVAQIVRWKRDILRSFLKRMNFMMFQKSVWAHAHDCRPELEVLKEFLGLSEKEIKLVVISDNGFSREDSAVLRKFFKV
ncbi:MAG: hypothetical protein G01um101430_593 [Parcubacteria group bacterium Gr01-1014_30]|nr:MAG: hypothetical protein G01um101430_593 [Parcubacteria group bacterium Gr01-1014_30]